MKTEDQEHTLKSSREKEILPERENSLNDSQCSLKSQAPEGSDMTFLSTFSPKVALFFIFHLNSNSKPFYMLVSKNLNILFLPVEEKEKNSKNIFSFPVKTFFRNAGKPKTFP